MKSKKLPATCSDTLVAHACAKVTEFTDLYKRFERRMVTSGHSASTLKNYGRHIAAVALHFNCLPTVLSNDQLEDYLHSILKESQPSETYFKHTIYGLRFLFRLEGCDDKRVELPTIKKQVKLPKVLSREEVKRLFKAATLLKHRLLLGFLYGCGLRCGEVRAIKVAHISIDRKQLYVPAFKTNHDRYVPLGNLLIKGIQQYLDCFKPATYFFHGKDFDSRYSQRGVQWTIQSLCKQAGIQNGASVHTLRHSYATHLLEDGLDIVSVKNLLGHARIETTMLYLHVMQKDRSRLFSPLDKLYSQD